jgi:hypothetical protein
MTANDTAKMIYFSTHLVVLVKRLLIMYFGRLETYRARGQQFHDKPKFCSNCGHDLKV